MRRRTLLHAAGASAAGAAAAPAISAVLAAAPAYGARPDFGVQAYPFPLTDVRLSAGRWLDTANRTLAYLRFIDANRMLYTFRRNYNLSTQGAAPMGGWEGPTVEIRGQGMGHFLTALAQAYAGTGEAGFRSKGDYLVAELAKCQAAAAGAGFRGGYLSAYPENHFDRLEAGQAVWAPWYVIHKILAGLLDWHVVTGSAQALSTLLNAAGWVDWRTGRLTYAQMQATLQNEFGGMNEVLANLYQVTGDVRWMNVARRFDHAVVFDPLAAGQDPLPGLHGNTQLAKVMGAVREYNATGEQRYRTIATNFWNTVLANHTYANGGNTNGEFFKTPGKISTELSDTNCETCNVYNLLKITRQLFFLNPTQSSYMDYYERALFNQILASQDPNSARGYVTYYQPMRSGGIKTYSNDYDTWWCCVDTGMENHTKYGDSIYFHNGETLWVNLFIPSVLTWRSRGMTVTQETGYPATDSTTLRFGGGSGRIVLRFRIPQWTSGATVRVNNGSPLAGVTSGQYFTVDRTFVAGDTVTVTMPKSIRLQPTNDDPNVQSVHFGPLLLVGGYGGTDLGNSFPTLNPTSIVATGTPLRFTATANGVGVPLLPFHDTHHQRYSVYWRTGGPAPSAWFRVQNRHSGKVLGVDGMSMNNSAHVVQFDDNGTADHLWRLVPNGDGWFRLQNRNSGKVLGVDGMSTASGAHVVQYDDNGTADHLWRFVDNGDGYARLVNRNSNKVMAVDGMSTANSAHATQWDDNGTADHLWRLIPDGSVRAQNKHSNKVLGVSDMSTANGAQVVQYDDNGTLDHLWQFRPDANGYFRIANVNSTKVLAVAGASTANGANIVQFDDNGAADHLFRLRYDADGWCRVQNLNSGRVLAVDGMSTANSARVVQFDDSGTADHRWRFI